MSERIDADRLRWTQRQRLDFVELRLFWEGEVSRSDLMTRFGVSAQQASIDLSDYREMAPENVRYDKARKAFVAERGFEPQLIAEDARQYLTQLLLLADRAIAPEAAWLGVVPDFAAIPRLRRRLDAAVLRPILNAIRRRRAVQIRYQSMSSPDPMDRWIAPHALAFDGARWHARSWCFNRARFTDFVLARTLTVLGERESTVDPKLDRAWHDHFVLQLAPDPSLTPAQQRVVELDFGMQDGMIEITMPLCLTYYFERHYNLDLDDSNQPARRQVVLKNKAELQRARDEVGINAKA